MRELRETNRAAEAQESNMISKAIVMSIAVLSLAGCEVYATHQAEKQVRAALKDPDSAQFSDMTIVGNGLLVCGKVNAKNSMGGYTGSRDFLIWADEGVTIADDELEGIRLRTCCTTLASAVTTKTDSKDVAGLGDACRDFVENDFSW